MSQVGRYFKASEFACPCCKKTAPSLTLVGVLDVARKAIGEPLRINSAYRCITHNAHVGGKSQSWHLEREGICYAADITYSDPSKRHGEHILKLYVLLENAARRRGVAYGMGLYSSFVHLDMRGAYKPSDGSASAKPARWDQYPWAR